MNAVPNHASDRLSGLRDAVDELLPALRAQAPAGRLARRLPRANVDALRAAGLVRVYNPRRFGGDELHMADVLPLVARVAEACPASAWVLAIYQIHNWVLALFPETAQQEVFARNPDPLVCASLNPAKNSVRRVDGGYHVERARFTFCSGAAAREWGLFGALVRDATGNVVDAGCLLIPGDAVAELDDWQVSGLQSTGSISLLAENLFVPAHRFLSYADATAYRTPGASLNPGALFRAAFVPMLVLNLAGPALGAAEAAWQAFVTHLRDKGAAAGAYPLPGLTRAEAPATHEVIANARLAIDTARLLLAEAGDCVRARAEDGVPMTPLQSASVNLQTSQAMRECLRAVQMLFLQAGGAVLQGEHPLQQAFQDVSAINCHGFLAHEANLALYGALALGQPRPGAFL